MLPIACASAAGVESPEFCALAGLLCPKASPDKHPPVFSRHGLSSDEDNPEQKPDAKGNCNGS